MKKNTFPVPDSLSNFASGRRALLAGLAAGAIAAALPRAAGAAEDVPPESGVPSGPSKNVFWKKADMDLFTAVYNRRSYRSFTGAPVAPEALQRILAAGMNAPSSKNSRPWHFVVMTRPESIAAVPKVIPLARYAVKAGAVILVGCENDRSDISFESALLSTACCGENMLLAATALGFGAVWVEIYPDEQRVNGWRTVCNIPTNITPVNLIVIGEPSASIDPVNRNDPKRIHYETW